MIFIGEGELSWCPTRAGSDPAYSFVAAVATHVFSILRKKRHNFRLTSFCFLM